MPCRAGRWRRRREDRHEDRTTDTDRLDQSPTGSRSCGCRSASWSRACISALSTRVSVASAPSTSASDQLSRRDAPRWASAILPGEGRGRDSRALTRDRAARRSGRQSKTGRAPHRGPVPRSRASTPSARAWPTNARPHGGTRRAGAALIAVERHPAAAAARWRRRTRRVTRTRLRAERTVRDPGSTVSPTLASPTAAMTVPTRRRPGRPPSHRIRSPARSTARSREPVAATATPIPSRRA